MACFLAPAAEAIVVSVIKHNCKKKEQKLSLGMESDGKLDQAENGRVSFSQKLGWLTNLLWGGCFLLAIEHIWHGEVVPWPPFLTAMSNPADTQAMLTEIATVGVSMAVLVTAVWAVMVLVYNRMEKRAGERVASASKSMGA